MGLSIRTVHGKSFRRAGYTFGTEPVVLSNEQLDKELERLNPNSKLKPVTVRQALQAEQILVCVETPEEKPVEEPGDKKSKKKD